MDDDLRNRIERYLAGGLKDAEAEALLETLRRDPEALSHLGRSLVQQAHLHDLLRSARSSSRRLPAVRGAGRRSARVWIAAAACAIVAVGVYVLTRPGGALRPDGTSGTVAEAGGAKESVEGPARPPVPRKVIVAPAPPRPAPVARLDAVEGLAFVVTDTGRILAHAEAPILPGQGVRVEEPAGRAVLALPGGTRIALAAGAAVTLFRRTDGVSFLLAGGSLDVTPAAAKAEAVTMATPHAEVSGAGARFRLRCDPDGTRVEVASGRVTFARGLDGETIPVAAGQRAAAVEGEAFAAVPMSEAAPAPMPERPPVTVVVPPAPVEPPAPAPPPTLRPDPIVAPATTRTVTARVERAGGDVRVVEAPGDASRPARPGTAVLSGQGVETCGDDAFAVVVCLDATRIEVGGNARAFFDAAGKRIALDHGALRADVAKQPRGTTVVLGTPHAEVKVLGTRFVLSADPRTTRVEVEEGTVRLARREDGASTRVMRRQYATVHGRKPLVARSVRLWRSYDTVMNPGGAPQAVVPDVSGRKAARLAFYESGVDGGVAPGRPLSVFVPGRHIDHGNRDRFNHCERYWAHAPKQYPYAGRSLVGRGADAGERGAPAPLRVRDLQLHPPNSDRLTVAAFIAPVDGRYRVRDLGVRRVDARGGPVRYVIHDAQRRRVATLKATPDRAWVWERRGFDIGALRAGDRIHFAVAREGDYGWDAAEIAWTVTATE